MSIERFDATEEFLVVPDVDENLEEDERGKRRRNELGSGSSRCRSTLREDQFRKLAIRRAPTNGINEKRGQGEGKGRTDALLVRLLRGRRSSSTKLEMRNEEAGWDMRETGESALFASSQNSRIKRREYGRAMVESDGMTTLGEEVGGKASL